MSYSSQSVIVRDASPHFHLFFLFNLTRVIYEGELRQGSLSGNSDENNLRKSAFKCPNNKVSLYFQRNSFLEGKRWSIYEIVTETAKKRPK